MIKAKLMLVLNDVRDIPLDKLVTSQAIVRRKPRLFVPVGDEGHAILAGAMIRHPLVRVNSKKRGSR
jgi:hypothetical protein